MLRKKILDYLLFKDYKECESDSEEYVLFEREWVSFLGCKSISVKVYEEDSGVRCDIDLKYARRPHWNKSTSNVYSDYASFNEDLWEHM